MLLPVSPGVSTAAGIASTVSIPVELVTPIVIGSSWTQRYGITIVLERNRPSVCGPSTSKGTIASSTVTEAIVRSSCCGFVTRTLISPGLNSTRRTSNRSGCGGFAPIRPTSDEPRCDEGPDDGREQHHRDERPEAPARLDPPRRPSLHQSTTSKKPIQPRSVNSDWCAWNMNRPVFVKSISSTPRCPWHCITVSVYSQLSPVPVGW